MPDLHLYLHVDLPAVTSLLTDILTQLRAMQAQEHTMDQATQDSLDKLNAAVAEQTTLEASVETLLTGLAAQITALKTGVTDPAVLAAIDAASAIVAADNAKTAAAVAANTPAA